MRLFQLSQTHLSINLVISDEQKEKFFTDLDLFVLPSSDEGFGIPVIEALKVGRPVLIFNDCTYIPHYYTNIPFGASMLLSFGLLLKARDQNKTYLIFLSIFILYYATTMRYDGFIAIFPICISIAHDLSR